MSIKTILVYVPSGKNAAATLGAALKIAGAGNAHVIGLHLTPDLPVYGEFPAEVSQEVIDRLRKAGEEAAAAARRAFEEAFKDSAVTHEWCGFIASYVMGADLIAQQGRAVDLIVCGKASDEVPDAWSDFAETALMRSGRPVLIVPSGAGGQAGRNACRYRLERHTRGREGGFRFARPDPGRSFGARDHLDRQ